MVNGIQQDPIEGTSLAYTFSDAGAAEQHKVQYFEMFANRGIYQDGWFATDNTQSQHGEETRLNRCRKINGNCIIANEDFSLANDLASQNPEKLKAMQDHVYGGS